MFLRLRYCQLENTALARVKHENSRDAFRMPSREQRASKEVASNSGIAESLSESREFIVMFDSTHERRARWIAGKI